MKDEDQEKIAFITDQGTYCLHFYLRNADTTYQWLVNKILHKQIDKNVEAYVDDILVKSCRVRNMLSDFQEVFNVLKESHIRLNLKKFIF